MSAVQPPTAVVFPTIATTDTLPGPCDHGAASRQLVSSARTVCVSRNKRASCDDGLSLELCDDGASSPSTASFTNTKYVTLWCSDRSVSKTLPEDLCRRTSGMLNSICSLCTPDSIDDNGKSIKDIALCIGRSCFEALSLYLTAYNDHHAMTTVHVPQPLPYVAHFGRLVLPWEHVFLKRVERRLASEYPPHLRLVQLLRAADYYDIPSLQLLVSIRMAFLTREIWDEETACAVYGTRALQQYVIPRPYHCVDH